MSGKQGARPMTFEEERRTQRRAQRKQDQRIRSLETQLRSSPPKFVRVRGDVTTAPPAAEV